MIHTGIVTGFNEQGAPMVKLDKLDAEVAVVPPKVRVIASTSAGSPAHTHTVTVGGIAANDRVSVVEGARDEWFVVNVY